MIREEKQRQDWSIRQARHRSAAPQPEAVGATGDVTPMSRECHADVPSMSRCSSSSSSKKEYVRTPKRSDEPAGFVRFYESYPRHEARKDALKAWLKLNPSAELEQQILAAVERRKHVDPRWRLGDRDFDLKYIPMPATFINRERWKDQLDVRTPASMNGLRTVEELERNS